MKKINAKAEKTERNKIYADKFKKDRKSRRGVSQYLNWCRTENHPASCNCAYPSHDEVVEASRKR